MKQKSSIDEITQEFAALEERLEQVITLCQQLAETNVSLQSERDVLKNERDDLQEHNTQLKTRVDAMVVRLKGLGHSV